MSHDLQEAADEVLLERVARSRDEAAFAILYRRHQGPLLHFLDRMINDVQMAEDLFQRTFLKAWEKSAQFAGNSSFKTWLYSIAVNLCRDQFRRSRRCLEVSLEAGKPHRNDVDEESSDGIAGVRPVEGPGPEDQARRKELRMLISRGVRLLPVDQREAFVLVRLGGLSYEETAKACGCTLSAAKMRVHRAHRELARFLAAHEIKEHMP